MKSTLRIKKSSIHGKGLFASEPIVEGTLLGYCRSRPTLRPGDYTLWLDQGPVDITCRLKYINHSAKPNVAYYDDLSVVALKDIDADEELTHHYGDDWRSKSK